MTRPVWLMFVAFVMLAAGCGSGATDTGPDAQVSTVLPTTVVEAPEAATDVFPVMVEAANGLVTVERRPVRVVSLSPTATETLFAIGAGPQVVAVDDFSNFPPEAPVSDLSAFSPNLEAIAAFEPDLVVISFDPGDVVVGLEVLGIPTLFQPPPATLSDAMAQMEQLGAVTGNVPEAAVLTADMRGSVDEIVASLGNLGGGLTYYHELNSSFFTATSSTFIGRLYGLLGLENIADGVDVEGSGFPQLSAEFIVTEDPSLIFLADTKCCGESLDTVAARPGWDVLSAVTSGAVVELDDDIASRWGPRIVDFLRIVAEAVVSVRATS